MFLAHVTNGISDEIASEEQQGKERENSQKSFALKPVHCAKSIS